MFSGSLSSEDGRFVVITTDATNLGGVHPPGGLSEDVFLRDRVAGTTELVTAGPDGVAFGGQAIDLTPDGRFVMVATGAALSPADLDGQFDHYVHDLVDGSWDLASTVDEGDGPFVGSGSLSDDGRRVAFMMNAHRPDSFAYEVYVRDLDARRTTLVSVTRSGRPASAKSA